jgi:hypothetical protein
MEPVERHEEVSNNIEPRVNSPVSSKTRESRVRPNLGSGGEPERLHLIGVLSFDDEFREDVAYGGIGRGTMV